MVGVGLGWRLIFIVLSKVGWCSVCVEIKKRGRERGDDMGSVTMYLVELGGGGGGGMVCTYMIFLVVFMGWGEGWVDWSGYIVLL